MSDIREAWGKKGVDGEVHWLWRHCFDVAACFRALAAQPTFRRSMVKTGGSAVNNQTVIERLCVLAFLHDVGKLNAGFQLKAGANRPSAPWTPAGHIGEGIQLFISDAQPILAVRNAIGIVEDLSKWGSGIFPLLLASLAHHGRPTSIDAGVKAHVIWHSQAGYDPVAAATLFGAAIRTYFPDAFIEGPPLPEAPEFQHLFAGMVALADQVGSREQTFSFPTPQDVDYPARATALAAASIASIGLDGTAIRKGLSHLPGQHKPVA